MSHSKERKEKNCLNCNAIVEGRYCSVCGQENLEPQEGVGHLLSHFFNDITHFDGKFFSSLKYLIVKPGFLSEEYMLGRRASYLNPVRMYIFTSFIFFFIFFSLPEKHESSFKNLRETTRIIDSARHAEDSVSRVKKDSIRNAEKNKDFEVSKSGIEFGNEFSNDREFRDRKEYDSLIDAGVVKQNLLMRFSNRLFLKWKEKYGDDAEKKMGENLWHSIPQMFLLALPLLALVLKLLYIRRKKFYYVSHGIFTIHLLVFGYIATLAIILFGRLSALPHLGWLSLVRTILILSIFYYLYRAMRNFYGQGRGKTILKFILVLFSLLLIATIAPALIALFVLYKT